MLYLCFLEVVRQVSANSKAQALVLLKIWHSHHEHTHNKVANTFTEIKQHLKRFELHVKSLADKYSAMLHEDSKRDEDFMRMKDRYLKSLYLIDVASQKLYIAEDRIQLLEQQLETLQQNIATLMPNFKQHFEDETLACKLMNWDTEFKIGLPDDHPLNIFKTKLDAQKKMFPEEAALLADVIRLKSVIRSNMVEGFAILKRERESIKLK